MIAQADHAQVIGLRQARFAVGVEFEQALLEGGEVGINRRFGIRRQPAQVGTNSWRVVPFQRGIPEVKLVLVVIREACKLLVQILVSHDE